jgi:hypothetical protein
VTEDIALQARGIENVLYDWKINSLLGQRQEMPSDEEIIKDSLDFDSIRDLSFFVSRAVV